MVPLGPVGSQRRCSRRRAGHGGSRAPGGGGSSRAPYRASGPPPPPGSRPCTPGPPRAGRPPGRRRSPRRRQPGRGGRSRWSRPWDRRSGGGRRVRPCGLGSPVSRRGPGPAGRGDAFGDRGALLLDRLGAQPVGVDVLGVSAVSSPKTCGWRWISFSTRPPATSSMAKGSSGSSSAMRAWKTTWRSTSPSSSRSSVGPRPRSPRPVRKPPRWRTWRGPGASSARSRGRSGGSGP